MGVQKVAAVIVVDEAFCCLFKGSKFGFGFPLSFHTGLEQTLVSSVPFFPSLQHHQTSPPAS